MGFEGIVPDPKEVSALDTALAKLSENFKSKERFEITIENIPVSVSKNENGTFSVFLESKSFTISQTDNGLQGFESTVSNKKRDSELSDRRYSIAIQAVNAFLASATDV